jgi:hypothetical protein
MDERMRDLGQLFLSPEYVHDRQHWGQLSSLRGHDGKCKRWSRENECGFTSIYTVRMRYYVGVKSC